jgi:hypothetical protein
MKCARGSRRRIPVSRKSLGGQTLVGHSNRDPESDSLCLQKSLLCSCSQVAGITLASVAGEQRGFSRKTHPAESYWFLLKLRLPHVGPLGFLGSSAQLKLISQQRRGSTVSGLAISVVVATLAAYPAESGHVNDCRGGCTRCHRVPLEPRAPLMAQWLTKTNDVIMRVVIATLGRVDN